MRKMVILALLLLGTGLFAQDQPKDPSPAPAAEPPADSQPPEQRCGLKKVGHCLKDLAHDQAGIWASPLRVKTHDAVWLLPLAGATTAAFAYDQDALRQVGTTNESLIDKSETFSEFGSPYATFGAASAVYFLGALKHNEHLRETGVLAAEAVANASLVTEGLKLATNRERPDEGLGTGGFWPHGTRTYSLDGSFPSGHAAASWGFARVIADEYPGWPIRLGVYGFATAISASRITGRQHFPSDVVVGGAVGYLIGGYVVRHHSSENQDGSGFTLRPVFDQTQHAYGMTVFVTPSSNQTEQVGRALAKLSSVFKHKRDSPSTLRVSLP